MNNIQGNNRAAHGRASRRGRVLGKPTTTNEKENENQENDVKEANTKGLKRSCSDNQIDTRKRSAFGDITNAIQSHADRIALARKKVLEKKCPSQIPPKKKGLTRQTRVTQPKRTSKRLKSSKSSSSIPEVFPMFVEDLTSAKEETNLEEQCNGILKSCSSTSSEETQVLEKSALPHGVIPFDLDEDPDLVCEYAHSIFRNMVLRDSFCPVADYLSSEGTLITGAMRAILVDWLVEVQENFQLYHETLYVTVKLLDYYLQNNNAPKEQLQLVGASALLIACKVEEYSPPPIDDLVYICNDCYTSKMFVGMEIKILKALNFDINIPISYRFLRRFSKVTLMHIELLTLARFILELSLHEARFVYQSSPKMAAACLCLAMKMANEGTWNANHSYHSGYMEEELLDLMQQLNQMIIELPNSKLKTVQRKYSHPVHYMVAKTKPLPSTAFSS